MANNKLGSNSFVNLFPSFVYDKDQVAERSLDIWNSYRLRVLRRSGNDTAFVFHSLRESDTYPNLAFEYYGDQKLWWLVPLVNDVEDPFTYLDQVLQQEEPIIKMLKSEFVGNIVFEITNAREFAQSLYNKNGENF